MKIAISSDLHFDLWGASSHQIAQQKCRFKNPNNEVDVLVLAGDIAEINSYQHFYEFFEFISNEYKYVITVLGNHEFYRGSMLDTAKKVKKIFNKLPRKNIKLLNQSSIKIGDIRFIGGTLWTSMDNESPFVLNPIRNVMNDYHYINVDETNVLLPKHTVWEHKKLVRYLNDSIKRYKRVGEKIVLVTHHGPSMQSIHKKYMNDREYFVNYAYCSDLFETGKLLSVDLAIHGHVHTDFDYVVEGTRVVCNPLGYPNQRADWDNYLMDEDFYLKIVEV